MMAGETMSLGSITRDRFLASHHRMTVTCGRDAQDSSPQAQLYREHSINVGSILVADWAFWGSGTDRVQESECPFDERKSQQSHYHSP